MNSDREISLHKCFTKGDAVVFQAGYTDEGKLQVVVVDIYIDGGFTHSCTAMLNEVLIHMDHGKHQKSFVFRLASKECESLS